MAGWSDRFAPIYLNSHVLLLAIETATNVCSVALFEDDKLLRHVSIDEPRSHASRLAPTIREVTEDTNLRMTDLDAIAVSAGPGSYTGLRIGASTAKGLAFSQDADLVAVPSLEAMALAAASETGTERVVAAFPSRRGEVYAAAFDVQNGQIANVKEATALVLEQAQSWLPDNVTLVAGPGADTLAEHLDIGPDLLSNAIPTAVAIGQLGIHRHKTGKTENVAEWEPFYLKSFVAKPPKPIFG